VGKIKLYLDEDVSPAIARVLRSRGYDVVSAHEVEMLAKSDEEQIEFASRTNRIIISFNSRHYSPLAKTYFFSGKEHAGIVVSKVIDISEMLRLLINLLEKAAPGDLKNSFKWLQEFQ
jgi:uncharacterized protein with PIN domain